MSTITAEVVEVPEVAGVAAVAKTTGRSARARHHEPPAMHVQCACSPGLRQPAWISECAYCGAGLN